MTPTAVMRFISRRRCRAAQQELQLFLSDSRSLSLRFHSGQGQALRAAFLFSLSLRPFFLFLFCARSSDRWPCAAELQPGLKVGRCGYCTRRARAVCRWPALLLHRRRTSPPVRALARWLAPCTGWCDGRPRPTGAGTAGQRGRSELACLLREWCSGSVRVVVHTAGHHRLRERGLKGDKKIDILGVVSASQLVPGISAVPSFRTCFIRWAMTTKGR